MTRYPCADPGYVTLLAVIWDSLEQLRERLEHVCAEMPPLTAPERFDTVRTDVLRWKNALLRYPHRSGLAKAYVSRLVALEKKVADLLPVEFIGTAPALLDRIHLAQNCIHDEGASRPAAGPGSRPQLSRPVFADTRFQSLFHWGDLQRDSR